MAPVRWKDHAWFQVYLLSLNFLMPLGFLSYGAEMEPQDSLVFFDEVLKITCKPSSKGIDLSKIQFQFLAGSRQWLYPPDELDIVNNTYVEANVLITNNFTWSTSVACMNDQTPLRTRKIYTEKPLIDVSDFRGFFLDDGPGSAIYLQWSNNPNYYIYPDAIGTNATIYRNSPPGNKSVAVDCPVDSDSCVAKYVGEDIIYINFKVYHKRASKRPGQGFLHPEYNTSMEFLHRFNLSEHRKTRPVTNVNILERQPTCIKLTWDLPTFLSDKCGDALCPWIIYQIELKSDETSAALYYEGSQEHAKISEPIQVCNLTEFTSYSLNVRIKVGETLPWSEPSQSVRLVTLEDRPLTGPPVKPTSYHVATPCENDERTVFVYWNAQPKSSLRGQLKWYEVVTPHTRRRLKSNFFRDEHFPCDAGTDVEIYSMTEPGLSLSPSSVYVPPASNELTWPQPDKVNFAVNENFTAELRMLKAHWDIDAFSGLSSAEISLVFYKCEEAEPNTCLGNYETTEVTVRKGEILENVTVPFNLMGYALKSSKGITSGIDWTQCIYQANQRPFPAVGLHASPGYKQGSLQVTWSASRCNRQSKVLILRYHVVVCPLSETISDFKVKNPKCKDKSLNSHLNSHIFFDLVYGQTYKVSLWSESPAGLSPEVSVEAKMMDHSSSSHWRPIVSFTVLGLIMMGSAIVCYFRCSKARSYVKKDSLGVWEQLEPKVFFCQLLRKLHKSLRGIKQA